MRWDGPIITDSGGFQVFSMGHGTVADEIKGTRARRAAAGRARSSSIEEAGVRFRSYVDGSEQFMGPEDSMAVQAALALATSRLPSTSARRSTSTRDYTARSTERTHRWLRALPGLARVSTARAGQLVYGIVQGGVHEDLRHASAAAVAASACDGIAIGGSLGQRQGADVRGRELATAGARQRGDASPRHLLGIGDIDDLLRGVELGHRHLRLRDADAAGPPRRRGRARPGGALARRPGEGDAAERDDEPILDGCPCPACAGGFTRAYLRHLLKAGELLAQRLITLHNLTFVSALMAELRAAIAADRWPTSMDRVQAGLFAFAAAPARPAGCTIS